MEISSTTTICSLPDELLVHIFGFCLLKEKALCRTVCQKWQAILESNELWKEYVEEPFPDPNVISLREWHYRSNYTCELDTEDFLKRGEEFAEAVSTLRKLVPWDQNAARKKAWAYKCLHHVTKTIGMIAAYCCFGSLLHDIDSRKPLFLGRGVEKIAVIQTSSFYQFFGWPTGLLMAAVEDASSRIVERAGVFVSRYLWLDSGHNFLPPFTGSVPNSTTRLIGQTTVLALGALNLVAAAECARKSKIDLAGIHTAIDNNDICKASWRGRIRNHGALQRAVSCLREHTKKPTTFLWETPQDATGSDYKRRISLCKAALGTLLTNHLQKDRVVGKQTALLLTKVWQNDPRLQYAITTRKCTLVEQLTQVVERGTQPPTPPDVKEALLKLKQELSGESLEQFKAADKRIGEYSESLGLTSHSPIAEHLKKIRSELSAAGKGKTVKFSAFKPAAESSQQPSTSRSVPQA